MVRLGKLYLIDLEATIFDQTLDRTVIHIHSVAFLALKTSFEEQSKASEEWPDENTGISKDQYEDFIRSEWMAQVRALATMTFALMETQLLGFLKTNLAFIGRRLRECEGTYGKKRDGEFRRLAAKYRECYDIEFESLPGVETCREVILARNDCIHHDCVPSENYKQKTCQRFVGADGLLILDESTLAIAAADLKRFTRALATAIRRQIDVAEAIKAEKPL